MKNGKCLRAKIQHFITSFQMQLSLSKRRANTNNRKHTKKAKNAFEKIKKKKKDGHDAARLNKLQWFLSVFSFSLSSSYASSFFFSFWMNANRTGSEHILIVLAKFSRWVFVLTGGWCSARKRNSNWFARQTQTATATYEIGIVSSRYCRSTSLLCIVRCRCRHRCKPSYARTLPIVKFKRKW